jgi:hypothetical protein
VPEQQGARTRRHKKVRAMEAEVFPQRALRCPWFCSVVPGGFRKM